MLAFIIKVVLANLVGDFLIQPTKWVKDKEERKERSPYLYFHIGIHALALLLVLQFQMKYWLGMLIILTTHLLIDIAKLRLTGRANNTFLFFADQFLHYFVIAVVVYIYYPYTLKVDYLFSEKVLLTVAFVLFVTMASSIVMRILIARWDVSELSKKASLENAGVYIGMLERLFVFGFIITNHWEGIGFLIAAKSVFRFGDLSRSEDRKLTEYILIGTLLSFGLAIVAGMGYLHILKLIQ